MGDGGNETRKEIETSPSSKKAIDSIDVSSSSPLPDTEGTPLRPIVCLKKRTDIKAYEDREDCFILDFDPYDPLDLSILSVPKPLHTSDLSVVAEKGQVACRDYPHSRHVCVEYPFDKTPHETCCDLCYCYVCDLAAPCELWSGIDGHCHAIANSEWKMRRKAMRKLPN